MRSKETRHEMRTDVERLSQEGKLKIFDTIITQPTEGNSYVACVSLQTVGGVIEEEKKKWVFHLSILITIQHSSLARVSCTKLWTLNYLLNIRPILSSLTLILGVAVVICESRTFHNLSVRKCSLLARIFFFLRESAACTGEILHLWPVPVAPRFLSFPSAVVRTKKGFDSQIFNFRILISRARDSNFATCEDGTHMPSECWHHSFSISTLLTAIRDWTQLTC